MREIEGDDSTRVDDLGQFAAQHGPALVKFSYLLTGGQVAEADDLVQSVFARLAARGMHGIDDPAHYVRRAIVNEHRSRGRHAAVVNRAMPRLVDPQHSHELEESEDRILLLEALKALSDRERTAVVLRYYVDLPDDEIATVLTCSRATVRSVIHRALPKLRTRLGQADPTADPAPYPPRGRQ